MSGGNKKGFTIIETMLFLAVSGALILMAMIGVGANIDTQRYRDSMVSFKSLLQSQYSELMSIQNGRQGEMSCDATARPRPVAKGQIAGQSNCMIVGKYVRIVNDQVTTYTVYTYEQAKPGDVSLDDVAIMRSATYYRFDVAKVDDSNVGAVDSQKKLEWGTKIAWPKLGSSGVETLPSNTATRSLGLLFIRSPTSGRVYTFTNNTAAAPNNASNDSMLKSMMGTETSVPGRSARIICVESGGLFNGGNMSIYLQQSANTSSSVEVRTNDTLPGGAKC